MRNKFALIIIVLLVSLSAITEGEGSKQEIEWLTNLEEAQQIAAEKELPIFVHFTGSDWCGWCVKLEDEVYSKSDFIDYAGKNLVMVKLDFPKYAPQTQDVKDYNSNLARKFGIQGFPTVVILDADANELARTGYQAGGAVNYIDHLKSILTKG